MVGRWPCLFMRQLVVYRSCYPSVRRCCAANGNLLHECVCVSPLVAFGSDAGVCLRITLRKTRWGQLDPRGDLGAMLRLALGSISGGMQLAAPGLVLNSAFRGDWSSGVSAGPARIVTWLILPVVICLSQRLSHACLSISNLYGETANGSLNQLSFI